MIDFGEQFTFSPSDMYRYVPDGFFPGVEGWAGEFYFQPLSCGWVTAERIGQLGTTKRVKEERTAQRSKANA